MSQSLLHRRVLVTRAAGQASPLAALLVEQGAEPILIPTIELAAPADWGALDEALSEVGSYDWLLFTSANAVEAYVQRARRLKVMGRPGRIAVIGPATARAVQGSGLAAGVDLMPPQYVAESFAEALLPYAAGARMLLVRAAEARDVLPDGLTAAGAHVTVADAYRSVVPKASVGAVAELFSVRPPDAITFTSASTARNLAALLRSAALTIPAGTVLASIGPITSQAMREQGIIPTVEARESTVLSLAEALSRHFSQGS